MLSIGDTIGEISESLAKVTTSIRQQRHSLKSPKRLQVPSRQAAANNEGGYSKSVPNSPARSRKTSSASGGQTIQWEELSDVQYIARGAFCTVHRATWRGKTVAVKKLRKDVKTSTGRRLMAAEEHILRQVGTHENIVKLLGSGIVEDPVRHIFLVLEFVHDGTLADFLELRKENGILRKVSLRDGLEFAMMFANAMCHLHHDAIPNQFCLHRDLKPDNLGFSEGKLKLMDFGLAKLMPRHSQENKSYKMTGDTGTLRYMAPEVAVHRPYNEKTDVYSFSLIVWQVLTLERPYEGMNSDQYFENVVENHVRPHLPLEWPQELCQLLSRCWHRNPKKRPSFPDIMSAMRSLRL